MESKMVIVYCGNCNIVLDECPSISPKERKPCPECDSLIRAFTVSFESKLEVKSSLRYKAKRGGKGRPFLESFTGASLSKKLQKWMHRELFIDRENDIYRESVTDIETGEIIHQCEEPLSQHKGHGDDKKT